MSTFHRAARVMWRCTTESGIPRRWAMAFCLCALWMAAGWALALWVLPPIPVLWWRIVNEAVFVGVSWWPGPLRYYIRYLLADWRIYRRNRAGTK